MLDTVLRNFVHLFHSILSVIRVAGVTISIVLKWKQSQAHVTEVVGSLMKQWFKSKSESEGHITLACQAFLESLLITTCFYDFKCSV